MSRKEMILPVLAVLAGVATALGGGRPTTVPVANVTWLFMVGFATVWAAARAPAWTIVWMAVVALATSATGPGALVGVAMVAVGLAIAAIASPSEDKRLRLAALVGALAVGVLLRQEPWGFHGASALVTAAALGPAWWFAWRDPALSVARAARAWPRRRRRVAVAIVAAPVLVLAVAIVLSLWASAQVSASLDSARTGRTDVGSEQLDRARFGFSAAHLLTSIPLAPARVVPVLSQHLDLLDRSTGEGVAMADAGRDVLDSGSYDGFKTADGRIDLARIESLKDPIDAAEARLVRARRTIAARSSPWLLAPVQSRLGSALGDIDSVIDEADLVAQAARTVPDMLGANGERVWFVAFVNPSEQRGGGGFLGSYAELRAENGRLEMTRSGSVLDLIAAAPVGTRSLTGPADYLERYGRFRPADFFQDITYSPNFPYTADVIEQLYPQSGGTHLDGILSVDPYALAALLRITGPIEVDGLDEPLTAENAARTILRDQYLLFDADATGDQSARRDVLDQAASATFRALLDGPLPSPRDMGNALGPVVRQRRLQMHAERQMEQDLIERLGMDGSMATDGPGDYLLVSHQNRGNSKIDAFLFRSTTYRAVVDPTDGHVEATVTVEMLNSAPDEGLPDYVIGNSQGEPAGSNVMTLSVYSHLAFGGASVDGEQVTATPGTEAGARVVSLPVVIGPGVKRTVVIRLNGQIDLADGYRVLAVPQPGVQADALTVEVRAGSADGAVVARRPVGFFDEPEVISERGSRARGG